MLGIYLPVIDYTGPLQNVQGEQLTEPIAWVSFD